MEQIAKSARLAWLPIPLRIIHQAKAPSGFRLYRKRLFGGKKYSVTEYTMSEIIASVYEKIEATGIAEGILFIDEINCVSETLAPTMLNSCSARRSETRKVPEGWIIVAAGNPPEYNKSVKGFLTL